MSCLRPSSVRTELVLTSSPLLRFERTGTTSPCRWSVSQLEISVDTLVRGGTIFSGSRSAQFIVASFVPFVSSPETDASSVRLVQNHTTAMPFIVPPPDFSVKELTERGLTGTCEVQVCRSCGPCECFVSVRGEGGLMQS